MLSSAVKQQNPAQVCSWGIGCSFKGLMLCSITTVSYASSEKPLKETQSRHLLAEGVWRPCSIHFSLQCFLTQFLAAAVRSICWQVPPMATRTVEKHSSPGQQLSRGTAPSWVAFSASSFLTEWEKGRGRREWLCLQIPLQHRAAKPATSQGPGEPAAEFPIFAVLERI